MPVLDWIGKSAVVRHHQDVPYRLLEPVPELSCGDPDSGNLIVQGDNLHALKALLPRYAGQVKCIYIDPPYNTGNEGWVYNDNVNSPEIRRWLGEVVGKEGETLDRHDRWLCMMYPRLVLLRQFLREDGVIFCHIGRDEVGHLRLLLDEIFGTKCLIETFVFVTEGNTENAEDVTSVHDYVLAYGRTPDGPHINPTIDPAVSDDSKLLRDFAENSIVKNGSANPASTVELPAGFPCEVESMDLAPDANVDAFMAAVTENGGWIRRDFKQRFNASYPLRLDRMRVQNGLLAAPCRIFSGWSSAAKLRRFIAGGCIPIEDDATKLRFFLTRNGVPTYRREGRQAHFVSTLLRNLGSTEKDKYELERMGLEFDYPKPRKLVSYLLGLYSGPGDIVMDSFAGSGTTGHAALETGQKFILIEMEPRNARAVVAPRLAHAVAGYSVQRGQKIARVAGLGGGFQFCRLSDEPLFTADGRIRADVTFAQLAEFVWFAETGSGRVESTRNTSRSPLLGIANGKAVFLLYNGILGDASDVGGNVLNGRTLEVLKREAGDFDGPWVVHGARTRFDAARLATLRIDFRQLPYRLQEVSWA